jgi:hypothetical protein
VKKVEFRLAMPGRSSADGSWSGSGRNYTLVRTMSDRRCAALFENQATRRWSHFFGDGWVASVNARIVPSGEKLARSDGFCGYDWMVDDIMATGTISEGSSRR